MTPCPYCHKDAVNVIPDVVDGWVGRWCRYCKQFVRSIRKIGPGGRPSASESSSVSEA